MKAVIALSGIPEVDVCFWRESGYLSVCRPPVRKRGWRKPGATQASPLQGIPAQWGSPVGAGQGGPKLCVTCGSAGQSPRGETWHGRENPVSHTRAGARRRSPWQLERGPGRARKHRPSAAGKPGKAGQGSPGPHGSRGEPCSGLWGARASAYTLPQCPGIPAPQGNPAGREELQTAQGFREAPRSTEGILDRHNRCSGALGSVFRFVCEC